MRRPLIAVLAVLTVLGPVLVAAPAQAAGSADWTVAVPADASGAARTGYDYALEPGGVVDDAVQVRNRGTDPLTLRVYAADGFTTSAGRLDLRGADAPGTGVGAWVRPDRGSVELPPGGSATVPFRVRVPADAAPGDRVGGVVTAVGGPTGERRLGIRVAVRVLGDLTPSLAVDDVRVDWSGGANPLAVGDAVVSWTVRNTGNTVVSAQQSAAVAAPFGWFSARSHRLPDTPRLLPGERHRVRAVLAAVPGLVALTATTAARPVAVDAAGTTSVQDAVVARGSGAAVPWALLALVLLAAVLVTATVLLERRRTRRAPAPPERAPREADDRVPASTRR